MPKRYQQPQIGALIDWGNPITKGMSVVYNPTSTASAIDNTVYGTSGTPTKTVNRLGQATYAAFASAAGKTRAFGKLTSAAECSIFGVVTPIGTLGATQAFGGCASTASANPLFLIGTGSTTASQLSFRVRNAAGTNQEVVSGSGVLVAGTPIIVAGSRSEAQNFHRVYANGLQVGTAAASAIGATAYNTFAAHGLLRSAFGLQVGSEVNLLMAWNRALTAEEIKSLSANPWQIFAPQSRQIWVPTAGGGTTISATPGNAVADGITASVQSATTISATPGNATATGITASIAQTIVTTPGNAVANGVSASVARTIVTTPGNAVADGVAANISTGSGTTISTTPGNAVADGYTAALNRIFGMEVGNAIAAGITASITNASTATVGRPASDTSNSGWTASTGSDLFAMLDEVTPDPADYIVATATGAVCELALGATAYPGTASQVLKFRASSSTGNSVIVRLKNTGGATVRSATQVLTSTDTEYSITLTSGEIAAITSGALSVELESA